MPTSATSTTLPRTDPNREGHAVRGRHPRDIPFAACVPRNRLWICRLCAGSFYIFQLHR